MRLNKNELSDECLNKGENKSRRLIFPSGFFWGTGTSAHQVEGDNHNDWTEWEYKNSVRLAKKSDKNWEFWQRNKFPEMADSKSYISGKACDHYNLYEKDFDIAKKLGHNAHKFSIEWSRIEPKEGKFDASQLAHYRAVVHALKAREIEPFVVLWHWTLPIWLSQKDGVLNKNFDKYFCRYAEYVVNGLKDDVQFWITLNEPTSYIGNGYFLGNWPPSKTNIFKGIKAYKKLAQAHNLAFDNIHKISSRAKISFANILYYNEPKNSASVVDKVVAKIFNYFSNEKMFRLIYGKLDYLAIQYYRPKKIGLGKIDRIPREDASDMGWEIYPRGLRHVLESVKKYNLPIYVTENGIADADDFKRAEFIKNHLIEIYRAIKEEGVDVRGYFYWSLLDNFEWDKGFWPRFGLLKVDYKTQKRTIRKSAEAYGDIIKNNGIEL
jgi:beta-glucosidase